MIQISHSPVVVTFRLERLDQASRIALIGACHAIADLLPQILSSLATTAGSEQIVIELVIASGVGTIEDRRRSSLQTDDNSRVGLVSKDVPTQPISLPAKVVRIVEASLHWQPLSIQSRLHIGICSHLRESYDSAFVADVRPCNLV